MRRCLRQIISKTDAMFSAGYVHRLAEGWVWEEGWPWRPAPPVGAPTRPPILWLSCSYRLRSPATCRPSRRPSGPSSPPDSTAPPVVCGTRGTSGQRIRDRMIAYRSRCSLSADDSVVSSSVSSFSESSSDSEDESCRRRRSCRSDRRFNRFVRTTLRRGRSVCRRR
jgi:hypothetical protein